MRRIFTYIQYLSLDVVAGAMISAAFVGAIVGVSLSWHILLGLGIAIWLIYTADHLMDARKVEGIASNPRHAYHQRNFKGLVIAGVALFGLGIWNIFYLPLSTIKIGAGLVLLVGLYFTSIQRFSNGRTFHKEVSAAVIYSVGVFVGPVSLMTTFDWPVLYLFVQFFLLALLNLLIFPLYESESDQQDRMGSIVLQLGEARVRLIARVIMVLLAISLILGMVYLNPLILSGYWLNGQYIFMLMLGVLYMLLLWPKHFAEGNLYRILGDGIFLVPAIIML